jgi:predicted Fe-Mo cluster-binding NifX family protein
MEVRSVAYKQRGSDMKIAIASTATGSVAEVSAHAARAPYYLIYDMNGSFQEAIANPYMGVERGAGRKAAEFLARLGVQLVVAEDFGERFASELEVDGIKPVRKKGIVDEIIIELSRAV